MEKVVEAAELANAKEFIEGFPDGCAFLRGRLIDLGHEWQQQGNSRRLTPPGLISRRSWRVA